MKEKTFEELIEEGLSTIDDFDDVPVLMLKLMQSIKDIAHTKGVLVGLKICKELWAQGAISHETIQEEIYHYQEELENLNSNQ